MKKIVGIIVGIGLIIIVVIGGIILIYQSQEPSGQGGEPGISKPEPPSPPSIATIRLGYSPYSLVNAHVGQTFAHTNILENNYLKGKIQTYNSDSALVKALKKGELDAVFTADVPAMLTLAQGYKGLIIASLGSLGRTTLMVLADSSVKRLKDLAGSKIGVTFGSPTHRNLLTTLKNEGLSIGEKDQDIQLIDVRVQQKLTMGLENGTFNAVMLCDPQVEQYLRKGTYRKIADRQFYSVVLMSRDFHNKDPQVTARFLTALKEAVYFTAKKRVVIDKLVASNSGVPSHIIASSSSINPNLRARSIDKVNLSLANYLPLLKATAQYIRQQKLAPKLVNTSEVTDPKIKEESARIISPDKFDLSKIKFTP